jgi:integrase
VFKYAIRCGPAERNPAEFLREVLEPRERGLVAAIGTEGLPEFLRALYANEACMGVPTRIAMKLMLLVFVRTSELIETPWVEIDVEKGEWIIPWKRRINPDKTDHHVCLSRQALGLPTRAGGRLHASVPFSEASRNVTSG